MARKADNIRAKLGWPLGILHPEGDRPKGMHQKTYEQLLQKYRMPKIYCYTCYPIRVVFIA